MPRAAARPARACSCSAARASSSMAAGETLEHTSMVSAPSRSMTPNLRSARLRLAAKRSGGIASKSRNGW